MSYGHASSVGEFISIAEDTLIGRLTSAVASTDVPSQRTAQIEAWGREIWLLKQQLASPEFHQWYIILEYEIPRRSRRPDVILLNSSTVFVIEFKMGARNFDSTSRWQVTSYARDLQDFHAESHGRSIVPVLCATDAQSGLTDFRDSIGQARDVNVVVKTNGVNLGSYLRQFQSTDDQTAAGPIVPKQWMDSPYRPTPTIIEAATLLYEKQDVRELSHRHAYNLDQTTEMLLREIADAQRLGRRTICFVTGIPGAGKTLTGLNVVHSRGLRQTSASPGIFLSGNGPLVNIVREAIVKSQINKGRKRYDCEQEASVFIQNVHIFLRQYLEDRPEEGPPENVVVFDEAQRAWDSTQMQRKRRKDASEASLLLQVMERLPDWAVVVALVGGGQEIFLGEAGLEEWGRALKERPVPWRVVASSEVLIGGTSVAGHKLFDGAVPATVSFQREPLAHLDVVVRNHRAQRWTEWINGLLSFRLDSARSRFPDTEEFPCYVTRDLTAARAWLRMHHNLDPEDRTGLVATSKDFRLRADGIERATQFLFNYRFDKWFLESNDDVRSSYSLEVAASEFECQGLELDWVGMCWGADLTPSVKGDAWDYRKFRGARWQNVRQEVERAFTLNRYRVLLTRARKGMVIWVPEGNPNDPTRDPARFDRVYDALCRAGVPKLDLDQVVPQEVV